MENRNEVVITGVGVVSPLGSGDEFWDNLINGVSGVGKVTKFDTTHFRCHLGAEAKFDPSKFELNGKEVRNLDSFSLYALGATRDAILDSRLELKGENPRGGVIIGTGNGGVESIGKDTKKYELNPDSNAARKINPRLVSRCMPNAATSAVSIKYGLTGPSYSPISACASGTHAVICGVEKIILGKADFIIAGGSEAAFTPNSYGSFANMGAMARGYPENPWEACRPFEAKREGFVMGEGSGIVVLESLEHAKERGAKIYAKIIGYGTSSDAYHIIAPDPSGKGIIQAMNVALEEAKLYGVSIKDVDYINAHGTSTPLNDKTECFAIKQVFGKYAPYIPVSSTKSMTGHLLGAAGSLETVVCAKTLEKGIIPPTINHENTAEDCKGLDYVPNVPREKDVEVVMNNSFGFGGLNAVLVLEKYKG
ncbi:MAG: beta-ketoacyl-ACP synthase II [Nanoarchaeota archaeon]|nr:beta-ketoacyl-ACP synthase II [Nanoarchaeota archaeon]